MQALVIVEIEKIGLGLAWLDQVLGSTSVEVLEAAPVSPGIFLSIFWGEIEQIEKALTLFSPEARIRTAIIDEHIDEIKNALFALSDQNLSEGLVIVESVSLATVCLVGLKMKRLIPNSRILEIKSTRSLGQKSVMFASCPVEAKDELGQVYQEFKLAERESFGISFIANPSSAFLQYFNP